MADISKITLPSGNTYNIKDEVARNAIDALSGYVTYMGVTTTALTDGSTTNPIIINGSEVTAEKGGIVNYGSKEFVWNGSAWQEFGDLSALGDLAYKDTASGSFTPAGNVTQPTFTGNSTTSTGNFTPAGNVTIHTAAQGTANYTPAGSVSTPTITVTPQTTTVNSITAVGTLPELTTTVADETLTIGFSQGTLPTKGVSTSVMTGVSATSSQPTFSGTGAVLQAEFSGTQGSVSVTGTPSGTVSKPTFQGTGATVTVS